MNRNRSLSLSMCSVWRRWTVVWLFFWPPWRWHQGPKEESGWHLRDNKQGNAKPRVNAIFYVPGRVGTGTKEAYYGGDPSRASMVGRVVLVPGTTGTSTSTSTGTGSTTGIPGPCGTGSDSGMGNFFLETETGNSHANAGATSPRLQNRTASTGNESATCHDWAVPVARTGLRRKFRITRKIENSRAETKNCGSSDDGP